MPERNQNLITGDPATDLVRQIARLEEELSELRENLQTEKDTL